MGAGRFADVELPSALARPLAVRLWSADGLAPDQPAPVLWCHDGSGYEHHCGLTGWVAGLVTAGTIPPVRVVLADAPRRTQIYSGSPRYLRSFGLALDALEHRHGVVGPVAIMGSSLGGLTSLACAVNDVRVGAVLTQSGSFFAADLDPQEADFAWFERIVRTTRGLAELPQARRREVAARLRVVLTCGDREENLANNRRMAQALRRQGVEVRTSWTAGGHDFANWCQLDPLWSDCLAQTWAADEGFSHPASAGTPRRRSGR